MRGNEDDKKEKKMVDELLVHISKVSYLVPPVSVPPPVWMPPIMSVPPPAAVTPTPAMMPAPAAVPAIG